MRLYFEPWKYIFKNLWFVLPFAVVPALFMGFSYDYHAISAVVASLATGGEGMDFATFWNCMSFLRFDTPIGITASVLAFLVIAVFMTMLLALIEKHLRIGKRSFHGAWRSFCDHFSFVFCFTLLFLVIYEGWALLASSLLYATACFCGTAISFSILSILLLLILLFGLISLVNCFYLWYPCRQLTGFPLFEAFSASYQLLSNVWWKLFFSLYCNLIVSFFVVALASAFLPEAVFRILAIFLSAALFLDFGVRMETTYFSVDHLDREDIIKSYREL